ncbi:sigma-54-dependent Fis family transcriptional regulator [Peribacillus asahii]|uniref:Acetoin dehydrogenase n=1 Tax=Peribacillus asahii TaxID=228899 RepID=A0A3T0KLJ3_9BACI|nr:sigma-54-dependent Fis family transcriptional regulator [Peribacillus asahii]AZV41197.1 acetoin dehydrogenase [Peribacillus asahii]USK85571.1 sigma-54-dependent Fis family transcriptional regulator [Peribacillus asahii]
MLASTSTFNNLSTWKRFISEGVLDSARLNKQIEESWYRCRQEQVNPYLREGNYVLTNELLTVQREKNALLMEIALPHLARMSPLIKESGMIALLVDSDGYVLSLSGNEKTLDDARKINFVEGVRWTEEEVGTNAIGTALQTGEAVMINGMEHYAIASHKWSCSAMPIYNERGIMMGVINFSCPITHSHPYMLGTVASMAYTIEQEIKIRSYRNELAFIQHAIKLADYYCNRHFIVCDQNEIIVSASKLVRQKIPKSIGMRLKEFLQYGYQIELESASLLTEGIEVSGKSLFLIEKEASASNRLFSAKTFHFEGEMGISETFQHTIKQVKQVASTEASVYLYGETGVGKELVARAIHENSSRKNGPFIALNCGAIPKDLMESELFGYVEGAFTGAKRQGYKGKFEQANEGTLFLDEIGEIPPAMQVALLRVLQERKVVPLGGNKEIPLNIRIITATHRNLNELVNEGTFRQDLYYRLNVYPIYIPSLRERREDLPLLASYICQQNNWNLPLTEELLDKLRNYHWPGNIRELQNVLQRLSILLLDEGIDYWELIHSMYSLGILQQVEEQVSMEFMDLENQLTIRERIQRDLMLEALQRTKGNVTAAAKLIDIPRSTFYKRLQKYGL